MDKLVFALLFLLCFKVEYSVSQSSAIKKGDYLAHKAVKPIVIDGEEADSDWAKAEWKAIDEAWIGAYPANSDFQGKYKMLWNENYIYYLVIITDDSLSDQHRSPFELWWEDDCLELFIDEDNSDGDHQYNHSAFAYHITLDYDVVDMNTQQKPILFNDHIIAKWIKTTANTYTWEVAMKVFDKSFDEKTKTNIPVKLVEGKKLGFAVSYNDNDGNFKRENMMASVPVEGEDKNRGWIDAGVFGTVELVK
jgi:hypothetical protein